MTLICLTVILYLTGRYIVLNRFIQIEEISATNDMVRIVNTINTELGDLANFTRDWAHWDDTYQFVEDANTAYVDANLQLETQLLNRMNIIVYVNESGETIYQKAVDLETEEEVAVPEEYFEMVAQIYDFEQTDEFITGITLIDDEPMLIAAYPILTSLIEGPVNGAMIQGRYLSEGLVEELSEKVNISFSLHSIGDSSVPPEITDELLNRYEINQSVVHPLSSAEIAGYTLLYDMFGEPVVIAKAVLARHIYLQGRVSMLYLALSTIVTGAIFGLALLIILDREVLARVTRLSKTVRRIGTANLSQRLEVTRRDEISSLMHSINDMLDTIEASQTSLKQFVDVVSHDLRSPLTAVRSYVYEIKEELKSGNIQQADADLQSIEKITNNMAEMLEGLLTLSRARKESYSKALVDIAQVIQKIRDNIGILLQEKNIIFRVASDLPTIEAYRQPIEEIFSNLITNAIKFSQDKPEPVVEVGCKELTTEYHFYIRDNGIGIAPENVPKLFTLFYHEGKYSQSGFGLSIVKEFVEIHGGRVWVDSAVGQGSTFWFSIPKM